MTGAFEVPWPSTTEVVAKLITFDGSKLHVRMLTMEEVYVYEMPDMVLEVPAPTYQQLKDMRNELDDPDMVFSAAGPRSKQYGPKPHRKFPVPR